MALWRRLLSPAPVVSCLTVTRDRVELLRRAVACFRQQTFGQAELVLVHDHDDAATAQYARENESETVRAVPASPGMKLGALRNLAVANARGEFVAQWDDDDWYAPDRLRLQLKKLKKAAKQACLLRRWTLYDMQTGRAYISPPRPWEGSIVARRSALNPYDDSLSRGEDTLVVDALAQRQELTLLDRPDLYIYVCHGRNTFERRHFEKHFAASQPLSPADTELVKSKLSSAAPPTPPLPEPIDPRARN